MGWGGAVVQAWRQRGPQRPHLDPGCFWDLGPDVISVAVTVAVSGVLTVRLSIHILTGLLLPAAHEIGSPPKHPCPRKALPRRPEGSLPQVLAQWVLEEAYPDVLFKTAAGPACVPTLNAASVLPK